MLEALHCINVPSPAPQKKKNTIDLPQLRCICGEGTGINRTKIK
jgi:hypothetical protein